MSKCQRELIHKVTTLPAKECSNQALLQISIPSWAGTAFIYNTCEDCQNEIAKYAQEEHEKQYRLMKEANRLT